MSLSSLRYHSPVKSNLCPSKSSSVICSNCAMVPFASRRISVSMSGRAVSIRAIVRRRSEVWYIQMCIRDRHFPQHHRHSDFPACRGVLHRIVQQVKEGFGCPLAVMGNGQILRAVHRHGDFLFLRFIIPSPACQMRTSRPVSYTHLDVYKRQVSKRRPDFLSNWITPVSSREVFTRA